MAASSFEAAFAAAVSQTQAAVLHVGGLRTSDTTALASGLWTVFLGPGCGPGGCGGDKPGDGDGPKGTGGTKGQPCRGEGKVEGLSFDQEFVMVDGECKQRTTASSRVCRGGEWTYPPPTVTYTDTPASNCQDAEDLLENPDDGSGGPVEVP